jgi:hypothetical protein
LVVDIELEGQIIEIDLGEYFLVNINKTFGILTNGINESMAA